MIRQGLIVCGFLTVLCPPALCAPSPRPDSARPAGLLDGFPKAKPMPALGEQLRISPDTEVLLDGQRCSIEMVPAEATILQMEIDRTQRLVLRIRFRSERQASRAERCPPP